MAKKATNDGKGTPKKHRGLKEAWKPGQSGNPNGRPKGSRNRLGEAFVADLLADWEKHGVSTLEQAREKDPAAYLRVVASLLPKDVRVQHHIIEELEAMEEGDIINRIEQLERSLTGGTAISPETAVH